MEIGLSWFVDKCSALSNKKSVTVYQINSITVYQNVYNDYMRSHFQNLDNLKKTKFNIMLESEFVWNIWIFFLYLKNANFASLKKIQVMFMF